MAFNFSPRIVTNGLVLYLDAANPNSYPGSGTNWKDISKSGLNGNLTNGPTYSSANGGSIVFDNVDDYVTLGTPSILSGLQIPLTIIAWAKPSTISGLKTIYGAYKTISGGSLYSMIRVDSGTLKYYTSNTSGGYQSFGTFTISANLWYFFAITVSGTISSPTLTIYLNNQSQSTSLSALSSTPDLTVDLRIGGNQATSNEIWAGNIANFQIYNRAFSQQEITQNYNTTKTRFGLT